jgi:NitT/TauT family transport system ATP-binding protein
MYLGEYAFPPSTSPGGRDDFQATDATGWSAAMRESRNTGAKGQAPLLRLEDISLCYPGNRIHVFEEISLEVREREIVALLGESGRGKSSLLNVAGGLLPCSRGQVSFRGENVHSTPHGVAVVFQNPCLLPWLNVGENIDFALGFKSLPLSSAERKRRVQAALREVGLEDWARTYPSQLSGGMAQRVSLARGLARQAELLLLDEPFSSLDAITRASMQELLLGIIHSHGSSALLVTHDLDEALLLADRLLLMTGTKGAAGLREWKVKEIFAAGTAPRQGVSGRDRRSGLFLDLREEIADSLAHSATVRVC